MITAQRIDGFGNTRYLKLIVGYNTHITIYTDPIHKFLTIPVVNALEVSVIDVPISFSDVTITEWSESDSGIYGVWIFVVEIGIQGFLYSNIKPSDPSKKRKREFPVPLRSQTQSVDIYRAKKIADNLKLWSLYIINNGLSITVNKDWEYPAISDINLVTKFDTKDQGRGFFDTKGNLVVKNEETKKRLIDYAVMMKQNNPKMIEEQQKTQRPTIVIDNFTEIEKYGGGKVFGDVDDIRELVGTDIMIRTKPLPIENKGAYLYKNPNIFGGDVVVMKNMDSYDDAVAYSAMISKLKVSDSLRVFDEFGLLRKYKKSSKGYMAIFRHSDGDSYSSLIYGQDTIRFRIKNFPLQPHYVIRNEIIHFYYDQPYFYSSEWLKNRTGCNLCIVQNVSTSSIGQCLSVIGMWLSEHKNIGFYGSKEELSGFDISIFTRSGELIEKIGDPTKQKAFLVCQKDCFGCDNFLYSSLLLL